MPKLKRRDQWAASSSLLTLPSELIVDILARLDPRDVSAVGRTCSELSRLVQHSAHLWRQLYLKSWDLPPGSSYITALPNTKGKGKEGVGPVSMQELVQRRRKARSQLRAGTRSLYRLLRDHTFILPTLIEAIRARSLRKVGTSGPNDETPFSRTVASLSSIFPPNAEGDLRWMTFVYPREDVTMLHDWQHTVRQDENKEARAKKGNKPAASASTERATISQRSPPASSSVKGKKKVSTPSNQNRHTRRSSRILRAKVPPPLRGFLRGDFDDGDEDVPLATVPYNEQLAAELHCLHGVRRMLPPKANGKGKGRTIKQTPPESSKKRRRNSASAGRAGDRLADELSDLDYESVDPQEEEEVPGFHPPPRYRTSNGRDAADSERALPPDPDEDGDEMLSDYNHVTMVVNIANNTMEELPPDVGSWSSLGSRNAFVGYGLLRTRAKEKVYDVGRYSYENGWGPLMPFRAKGKGSIRVRNGTLAGERRMLVDEEITNRSAAGHGLESDSDSSSDAVSFGPDDPVIEVDDSEVEDLLRDRAAAGDGSASSIQDTDINTNGLGDDVFNDYNDSDFMRYDFLGDGFLDEGEEGEDDDSDDFGGYMSDDSEVFDYLTDRNRVDLFTRMVREVAAYSGSKVRNAVEDLRKAEGSKKDCPSIKDPSQRSSSDKETGLVWQRERSIDWILLEAIMVAVHCSLTNAITSVNWGRGFKLPFGAKGDAPNASGLGSLDPCVHSRNRRLIEPPSGWHLSRGQDFASIQQQTKGSGSIDDDSGIQIERPISTPTSNGTSDETSKPFDWANVESATWVGTYFFSDYPMFLRYNASLARDPNTLQNGKHQIRHEEAVGDCLQLRLDLNATSRQGVEHEEGIEEASSNGMEDVEFPTLRFTGHTLTYHDDEPPQSRGRAHGYVRPVYTSPLRYNRYHPPTQEWLPEIAGIHWKIIHAYDGEDRWSLCGVQAGPPGTRSPIYGIWSDVEDEEASPVGPFCYMNVDSRPWREVERLIRQEEEQERNGPRGPRASRGPLAP